MPSKNKIVRTYADYKFRKQNATKRKNISEQNENLPATTKTVKRNGKKSKAVTSIIILDDTAGDKINCDNNTLDSMRWRDSFDRILGKR